MMGEIPTAAMIRDEEPKFWCGVGNEDRTEVLLPVMRRWAAWAAMGED